MSKTLVAACTVAAGYGTTTVDPETGDCFLESYASILSIELNPEYWSQYETDCSNALANDFDLFQSFDTFKLFVFDDGSRESQYVGTRYP